MKFRLDFCFTGIYFEVRWLVFIFHDRIEYCHTTEIFAFMRIWLLYFEIQNFTECFHLKKTLYRTTIWKVNCLGLAGHVTAFNG